MNHVSNLRTLLALAVFGTIGSVPAAAQFINPTTPTQLPNSAPPGVSQASPTQVRDVMLLRALQSRSSGSGGVRTGVPQFIPFGNFMGGMPMWQQQNTAAPAAQDATDNRSNADKRAAYEAARAERKAKMQERAEKRKVELEARRAAARAKAQAAADPPAGDPAQP